MRAVAFVGLGVVAAVSWLGGSLGCSKPQPTAPGADADASPSSATGASSGSSSSSGSSNDNGLASSPVPPGASACGKGCLRFDSEEAAFRFVLTTKPVVLAVGEAHAQKGTEKLDSSTKRFTDLLLPIAAKQSATDIVVELWAPDPSCKKEVAQTAAAQKPVVAAQAETNQNEYLTLGTKAKALGLTPWLLKPTCNDFSNIADAGADAVGIMLGLVKKLTQQKLAQLLQRNTADGGDPRMVLAYGGAMHNDLAPDPDTKDYSFGPELAAFTHERYTELDLIVPEYIKDTPVWTKLPWYATYKSDKLVPGKTTLYTTGPRSFTIVFPPSS